MKSFRDWPVLALLAVGALFAIMAQLPCAAAEPAETVVLRAQYEVQRGKLQVQYLPTDEEAERNFRAFYDGNEKIALLYRERVLQEVNETLGSLNPIIDWATPDIDEREGTIWDTLSAQHKEATNGTFSLRGWLNRFVGPERGTFFDWRPTRPPSIRDGDRDKAAAPDRALKMILTSSAVSLIGTISQDEVGTVGATNEPVLRIRFHKAVPISGVTVADMDVPPDWKRAKEPYWKEFAAEKDRIERELSKGTRYIGLAWNNDLAVQRMMTVMRGRGLWNKFAEAPVGNPHAVHWLTFDLKTSQPVVHLPHLCYLVFEPSATNSQTIRTVTRKLLRREELEVVEKAVRMWEGQEPVDERVKHIVSAPRKNRGGARVIDLYSLAAYLISRDMRAGSHHYPPLPLKQNWLNTKLGEIENLGLNVWDQPTVTVDNRVFDSSNPRRKSFERGGVDIYVSARKKKEEDEPAAATSGTESNKTTVTTVPWPKGIKYRVELGVSLEDREPIGGVGRLSLIDAEVLGITSLELRYQYQLSAKFEWQPIETSTPSLLPSSVSVFRHSSPRREIEGDKFEMQRDGIRVEKSRKFDDAVRMKRLDAALQFARVRDLEASEQSTANEAGIAGGFLIVSEPNAWDGREYWKLQIRATPTVRDGSDFDSWVATEGSGQLRLPRGSWDYFGSIDLRSVVGSAPLDAFPYLGGSEGVRGVRPYRVPARTVVVVRNEIWSQAPFIARDVGSGQNWFGRMYDVVRVAAFWDTGWASGIREEAPTNPWFFSPGVGLRLILGPTHLSLDYGYGITKPSWLGGHRISFGVTTRF